MQNKKEYLELIEIYVNKNNIILDNLKTNYDLTNKLNLLNNNIKFLENNLNLIIKEIEHKLYILEDNIKEEINKEKNIFILFFFKKQNENKIINDINSYILLKNEYLYCKFNKEKDINILKNKIKNISYIFK